MGPADFLHTVYDTRRQLVIGIHIEHIFAFSRAGTMQPCRGNAFSRRLQHAYARVSIRPDNLRSIVRRIVVDYNQLPATILSQHAVNGLSDAPGSVINRQNYTYKNLFHTAKVVISSDFCANFATKLLSEA